MIFFQVGACLTCAAVGAYAGLMAGHALIYQVTKRIMFKQLDEQLQMPRHSSE